MFKSTKNAAKPKGIPTSGVALKITSHATEIIDILFGPKAVMFYKALNTYGIIPCYDGPDLSVVHNREKMERKWLHCFSSP